jgi:type II secretory pathway pseudopilin PulG
MRVALVVAIVVAVIAVIVAVVCAKRLSKARRQVQGLLTSNAELSIELSDLRAIAWVRGAKGRFERVTPKKEEIVPGVTSEHANTVAGA